MEWKRAIWRVGIFAFLGLVMEVCFTAAFALASGNWSMHGHTSPWMLLVYGWLGITIAPVSGLLKRAGIPLLGRAAIYMILIFVVEYVYGVVFTAAGLKIWDYSNLRYNLHGHITLLWTPFWFALGLVLETLHTRVDACAFVLAYGNQHGDGEASMGVCPRKDDAGKSGREYETDERPIE